MVYDSAKCIARQAMHHAHHETEKVVYENIGLKLSDIFHLANQMWWENVDVVGHKLVRNDAGEMSMSKVSKQKAWLEHYKRLLKVEFAIANCDMNFSTF